MQHKCTCARRDVCRPVRAVKAVERECTCPGPGKPSFLPPELLKA